MHDVTIIGAGPAGSSAALTLAAHGVSSLLIDRAGEPGGQYYKHYSAAPHTSRGRELDLLHAQGATINALLQDPLITTRYNTEVWGHFPPHQLALVSDNVVDVITSPITLFATGAMERVAAFPGWTLPGVMTAGAAQRLLSHEGIIPGKRFVFAGTGPLLTAIAAQIAEAGGEVVAVLDCTDFTRPLRSIGTATQALRQPARIKQLAGYRRTLRRAGARYLTGYTVVRAHGSEHVEAIEIAQRTPSWHVASDTLETLQADTLCIHYGFAASVELPQLVGCELEYHPERGGWHVAHDTGMRTSVDGCYVAGQPSSVGGADLTDATGTLAGLTIAHDLGKLSAEDYRTAAAPVTALVNRAQGFASMLNTVYSPGAGVSRLVQPDTLLCRCEEVTAAVVDRSVATGASTLNGVKRQTRCGMGFCQGRVCSQVLSSYLEYVHGLAPATTGCFTSRVPLIPMPLSALATMPEVEP